MTKREAMRRTMMNDNLMTLGFSGGECEQLRRISLTLSHWSERECNEDIQIGFKRDGAFVPCASREECKDYGNTCRTYVINHNGPEAYSYQIPNKEQGALKRLAAIMKPHARLTYYYQTDPRGAALYIIERKRYNEFKAQHLARKGASSDNGTACGLDLCYSSIGIAVY